MAALCMCLASMVAMAQPPSSVSAQGGVAAAVARFPDDRAAGLAELRAIWEDVASPEAGEAAVALVAEMARGPERVQLAALGEAMLDSGRLDAEHAPRVFNAWTQGLAAAKRWPEDDSALRARAQAISDAAPDYAAGALPWSSIGIAEIGLGRFAGAEQSLKRAIALLESMPASDALVSVRANLGIALAQQGKTGEALDAFLASESVREAIGQPATWSISNNLAGLYIAMKRWDRAVEYSQRSIALTEPDSAQRARALNTLGNGLFGLDDLAGARDAFEQSLAISDRLGATSVSGLNNLAFILLKQGETREALRRFEQVEKLADAETDPTLAGVANKNLGETWIALGDRQRADAYLQKARAIYASTDNRPKRLELYPVLIDNLEVLGRHAEALERMREFKVLSDEMVNVASNERIAELENAAELRRKEAELALRDADLERLRAQESAERLQQQVMLGGQFGLLLVLGLMLLNLRNKSRANRALTRKNSEIEAQRARLQQLNEVVRRQSEEDALTGLGNRRHLQARLAREFQAGGATPSTPLLAIVVDLDHFKRINDAHGHPAGDRVLQHVANVLRQCQRAGDDLIRWGGEEFIWLCPNARAEQGPALCQRLQQALAAAPVDLDGVVQRVTASLGFAALPLWPDRAADADLSLRLADHAVYEAKHAGRDTWRGYAGGLPPPAGVDLGRLPVATMQSSNWLVQMAPG
jgi:diguanylate cyclase (GGDEF)-like protein